MTGAVRGFGLDMFLGWRNLGPFALIYVAFAVSALMAGVVLAGLAGRQVRAAGALIVTEPVMVLGAAVVGLAALLTVGILAIVTIVGIPFAIGLLGVVLPGLFVIGYIVSGIWLGELILAQSSPAARATVPRRDHRPDDRRARQLAPPIGGLISFVGFGAVMLCRGASSGAPRSRSRGVGHGPGRPGCELIAARHPAERPSRPAAADGSNGQDVALVCRWPAARPRAEGRRHVRLSHVRSAGPHRSSFCLVAGRGEGHRRT